MSQPESAVEQAKRFLAERKAENKAQRVRMREGAPALLAAAKKLDQEWRGWILVGVGLEDDIPQAHELLEVFDELRAAIEKIGEQW